MLTYWTLIRWVHVAGAVIWLGGVFFVVFMLRPALQKVPEPFVRRFVLSQTVERMRKVMNVVVTTQVLTGGYMAWVKLQLWDMLKHTPLAPLLITKIALATLMISLYVVVPRLLLSGGGGHHHCEEEQGPSPKQKWGHLLHLVKLVLGFTIILIAKLLT